MIRRASDGRVTTDSEPRNRRREELRALADRVASRNRICLTCLHCGDTFSEVPQPKFDAADFMRRQEAGEFDSTLADEIDKLSLAELEELAFLVASQLKTKAAGAS